MLENSPVVARQRRILLPYLCCIFSAGFAPNALCAEPPLNERVLVVYNASASDSLAVAKYYIARRQIPAAHLCRIAAGPESVTKEQFESRVKTPIRKCLEAAGRQKILYIVFSYLTPYLLHSQNRIFALDQFVADIWDEYSPANSASRPTQPYFGEAQSEGGAYESFIGLAAYRDRPGALNVYSVWRLDAANASLAKGLADKAIFAETYGLKGKACFDRQHGSIAQLPDYGSGSGDWDIHRAAEFAERAGFPVIEDDQPAEFGTAPAPLRCDGAVLYAGWYSLNHYNDAFIWYPGAIGIHLDSASAANPRGGTNWAANAIMKGITITSGAVSEPYLEGLPHPDEVLLYMFQGSNAGDALLRSTRWLKWTIVNLGDPLYCPFPQGVNTQLSNPVLALTPQSIAGGATSAGVIVLPSPAPEGGTTLKFDTNHPEIVELPKTVQAPARENVIKFAFKSHAVANEQLVRISITAGGLSRSNTLIVRPYLAGITLNPAKVGGGASVMATITLYQNAPAEGLTVALSSGNPELVTVPAQAKIPAGANSVSVRIATAATPTEKSSVITASHAGANRTVTLTVIP